MELCVIHHRELLFKYIMKFVFWKKIWSRARRLFPLELVKEKNNANNPLTLPIKTFEGYAVLCLTVYLNKRYM